MIKVRDYESNSLEWVWAKFFSCWKRGAWTQILDYVQPSWLAQHEEPSRILRLSLHKLIDAELIQVNANTGIVAIFLMNIHRKFNKVDFNTLCSVRLVREGKKWGVDPNSLI